MRVGDAARQLGTSARMLRYAEQLGLVAPARYRDHDERDLRATNVLVAGKASVTVTTPSPGTGG